LNANPGFAAIFNSLLIHNGVDFSVLFSFNILNSAALKLPRKINSGTAFKQENINQNLGQHLAQSYREFYTELLALIGFRTTNGGSGLQFNKMDLN